MTDPKHTPTENAAATAHKKVADAKDTAAEKVGDARTKAAAKVEKAPAPRRRRRFAFRRAG